MSAAAPAAPAAPAAAPVKKEEKKAPKRKMNPAETWILGGLSAGVSKTAAAPIERVKLLIQTQSKLLKAGLIDRPYDGIGDCFKRTIATEGFGALWRGNLANVLRYFPTQAFNLTFNAFFKTMFPWKKDKDGFAMWFLGYLLSGGLAGAASLTIVYHLDFARTLLANDLKGKGGGERKYKGLVDVYVKTFQSEGPLGLYKGYVTSVQGIIMYRGFYFGLYDVGKELAPWNPKDPKNFLLNFGLAYGCTVTAGVFSYPWDTIRRLMMMEKYSSSLACWQKVIRENGFKSLFNGAGANILRGAAGAGVLSGMDLLQGFYLDWKYGPAAPGEKRGGGGE